MRYFISKYGRNSSCEQCRMIEIWMVRRDNVFYALWALLFFSLTLFSSSIFFSFSLFFFIISDNQMVFRWWMRCDSVCESWFFFLNWYNFCLVVCLLVFLIYLFCWCFSTWWLRRSIECVCWTCMWFFCYFYYYWRRWWLWITFNFMFRFFVADF